ncbi:MAG: BTAD domain-containing putative transcriptional regulator [Anaerolineae bacterium]
MALLRIALLGGVTVAHDGISAPLKITRTGQTLLAYMMINGYRQHPRDVLADLIWGEQTQTQAHRCLSTALWRLRRELEPPGVPRGTYLMTSASGDIGFNWESDHWLDVAAFESQLGDALARPLEQMEPADADRIEAGLRLYRGDCLEGFYDHWALAHREHLFCLYLNGLTRLMRFHARNGQYEAGLSYGLKALQHDPLREETQREVIRLYWLTGQRSQAIRQYEACRTLLANELGIAPMEETQALYHQISQEPAEPHGGSPALAQLADSPAPPVELRAVAPPTSTALAKPTELSDIELRLEEAIRMLNRASDHLQSVVRLLEEQTLHQGQR